MFSVLICSCSRLIGSYTVGHSLAIISVLVTKTTALTKVIRCASSVTSVTLTMMTCCDTSENSISTVTSVSRVAPATSISGIWWMGDTFPQHSYQTALIQWLTVWLCDYRCRFFRRVISQELHMIADRNWRPCPLWESTPSHPSFLM